jgi:CheY-like chemotaxis protein
LARKSLNFLQNLYGGIPVAWILSLAPEKGAFMESPVILVIEDLPTVRHSMVAILGEAGFRTRQAATAEEAVGMARKECPSLILADMSQPDSQGWAALAILREDPTFWSVPVILVSGLERGELGQKMTQVGAVDLLPKPFHPGELIRSVRHWVAQN